MTIRTITSIINELSEVQKELNKMAENPPMHMGDADLLFAKRIMLFDELLVMRVRDMNVLELAGIIHDICR